MKNFCATHRQQENNNNSRSSHTTHTHKKIAKIKNDEKMRAEKCSPEKLQCC